MSGVPRDIDRVTSEAVIANRLDSIAREMGLVLERSARSPIFAEACDFACGICDASGELVSQLSGIPILAAAGSFSVKAVLARYGESLADGDAFVVNDPYEGGNHLPDIGIITPVFAGGEPLFFCVSRAHHGDIGGSAPGSYNSKATEIFQEGLRIPPTRLARWGELDEELLRLLARNTRDPDTFSADLLAQLGANRIGRERLLTLVEAHSAPELRETVTHILKAGEELTRGRLHEIPDGDYSGVEHVDDDGFEDEPIHVQVTLRKRGDEVVVDFSGTAPQVTGFVNSSLVTTNSAAYLAVCWLLGPDVPRNGGSFRAIQVHAPRGSLVNPDPPAPVTLCTLTPAGEIIAAILKAMVGVLPERVPAGFGRYCGPSFFGVDPRTERFYVGFAFCGLGSGGALPGADGRPYMAPLSNYGGVRTPNIEANEVQYPHLTLRHELEPDTAGPGRWRGGPGVRYEFQPYDVAPGIAMFGDGVKIPPYGLAGGYPGSPNHPRLLTGEDLVCLRSKEAPRSLQPGDVVSLVSAGGGGWGDPAEREPEAVLHDVRDGLVSEQAAREVYGLTDSPGPYSDSTPSLAPTQEA